MDTIKIALGIGFAITGALIIALLVTTVLHRRPAAPAWVVLSCRALIATGKYPGTQEQCLDGAHQEGDY